MRLCVPAAVASTVLAFHAARAALDSHAQALLLREAAFVPARWIAALFPDHVAGRLADAPRDTVEIAAFWLGNGPAPWSAVSYALVHAGWAHALSNAALLAVFGAFVARRLSALRLITLLGLGAIAGAMAQMSAFDSDFAPLVGASACVCALIGAQARLSSEPGAALGPAGPPAAHLESLASAFRRPSTRAALAAGLVVIATTAALGDDAAPIAWRAHLGGFLMGFIAIGALAGSRSRRPPRTCRLRRTDASFASD